MLANIRDDYAKNRGEKSCEVENLCSESSTPACSEGRSLDQLDPGQIEHFRDWLLINSTCRRFRALGKRAFFSEKMFILRPQFLMNLFARTTKNISSENIATALAWIRHVIAPVLASQFMILPQYNALQRLRSLSIQPHRRDANIFSTLNIPTRKRKPLPEELSSLLRHLGLRVDQLQMDLLYDASAREHLLQMKCLTLQVYPYLRVFSAHKNRKFRESENIE
ncbi:hypothetical protein MMC29_001955 [Sticta canariensis]|nr:hypothetical protein [Sticta canariensis]